MGVTRVRGISRGQKLCLLVAVVGIGLASATLWRFKRVKSEPTFEGRTVSEWIVSSDFETNRPRFDLAFSIMGESTVPALTRKLRLGSKLERRFLQNAPIWLRRRWPIRWNLHTTRERAISAIEVLGHVARRATSDLLTVAQDKTEFPDLRARAIEVLWAINAEPVTVIPDLEGLKNDANPMVASVATSFARRFRELTEVEARRKLDNTATTNFLNRTSLWDAKPALWEKAK